ncbi:MAG: SUMF1/EgtB/PvdO family nonheme iron enzyme [Planctomycetia bacterium]|nr:SUMF1/EgtB/PvdO family nonheme iron enzyme [Planctomycetia bacterium]
MKKCAFLLFLFFGSLVFNGELYSQTTMKTRHWGNDPRNFAEMNTEIQDNVPFNLLAFPETKLIEVKGIGAGSVPLLYDGTAGVLGGDGRVAVNEKPSRLVFYLGKPRSIKSIRLFTGNIDTRANQDFEVRLANNEKNPGKKPEFPKDATFTSGPKVIGGNNGGYSSFIENTDANKNVADQKFDWIEFRLWPTWQAWAGHMGKEKNAAQSWGSYVEIQVLGDPKVEPSLFKNDAERKAWEQEMNRRQAERKVSSLGSDVLFAFNRPEALKRAIVDLVEKYPEEYKSKNYLARWEEFNKRIKASQSDPEAAFAVAKEYDAFRREVLLSNPLLDFEKILVRKSKNAGLVANWISNASRNRDAKYDASLVTLDLKDLNAPLKEIVKAPHDSFIGDISLHWDGNKCLVTALSDKKTWQIFECNLENGALKQITPDMGGDVNNVEGCYVPDGATIFISSASMMGVPCIGGSDVVGNIYRLEKDGKTVRQLTFEQDQDWCPVLLENGRILYLRWEYVDITHYFSRIMMTMNPDGTNQVEHYGSGSFWPNSMFYARPIPGQSSKFVAIVSGHHGIQRSGELVIFDPTKGRREETGVVQRIPDYGKKVEPIIADQLVRDSWPQFLFPWPISDDLFLVSAKIRPNDAWALYLVDIFDNMIKLREEPGYTLLEGQPLIEQETPQTIPDRTTPNAKEANVFITDLYFGQGLPNVPKGTVKKLRVYAVSYGYRGIGGHDVFGIESCWDARRLIGEVPVFPDGSARFNIPSNTPLVLQPLDDQGAAVQGMRSWFVGMPGENVSCIGCHEDQNSVSPVKSTMAQKAQPANISNFYGPERPFAFDKEIQPVLDKFCVGCHNGEKPERPNFADTSFGPGTRNFSKSYHALHPYVRRSGPESDIHPFKPMEYHVSTSELIQMLRKGHHNVQLDQEAWQKLYTWIDLNVPYFGTWMDISNAMSEAKKNATKDGKKYPYGFKDPEYTGKIADRYIELKKMYTGLDLNYESDSLDKSKLKRPEFVKPKETPDPDFTSPKPNWGFDAAKAKAMQNASKKTIALSDAISFDLVKIPAGEFVMGDDCGFLDELPRSAAKVEKPFWMMSTEVTNEMYNLFDATHDSRFIDQWNKDHVRPGYAANLPKQPVIRISWQEANEFCKWLSKKTGKKFRLPTEAEWEWAARAGSPEPMWFGKLNADFSKKENLSDESTRLFVVRGIDPQPYKHQDWEAFIPRAEGIDDGNMIEANVGSYEPNPWGLFDMIGNVAEWTQSDYKPYPYKDDDGRNAGSLEAQKVAKGGSWRDRPKWGRAGLRRNYESWQKVFNIGFRVVCDD